MTRYHVAVAACIIGLLLGLLGLAWHGDLILGQTPDEMETGLVPVILE